MEVIVPTKTLTFSTTDVVTVYPTGAKDLGTFTYVTTISSTKTLETLTVTSTACGATGIAVAPVYTTIYTDQTPSSYYTDTSSSTPAGLSPYKRAIGLTPRDGACTVTSTFTTTYGVTYTDVPAGKTSTFSDYTAFTQATVTSTKSGGATAYAIATATTTTSKPVCGTSTITGTQTSTLTQDARCEPSAMTSAYRGFGLLYKSDVPGSGAAWSTITSDASTCCQLCASAPHCAAMAWDIRTNKCTLEFPVWFSSGDFSCGNGLLAYYDAGPNHPMAPGTGLFVQALCGDVSFGSAKPDDGT